MRLEDGEENTTFFLVPRKHKHKEAILQFTIIEVEIKKKVNC